MMLSALLWNLLLTSVMAIVLAGACRLPWMRRRPAARHALWLLLLAKMITPPLIAVPMLPAPENANVVAAALSSIQPPDERDPSFQHRTLPRDSFPGANATLGNEPENRVTGHIPSAKHEETRQPRYLHLLLALSFAVTLVLLAIHTIRGATVCRWLTRAGTDNSVLAKCCADVAASLRIQGTVRSCVVDARTAPMLWGCRRPMVVIPRRLVDDLSPEQLRSIVAHELAHFLRRDPWSNLFAFLVKVLMWWNPVAWWAHRELRAAQELCCDAIAIDVSNRTCYATTLLKAVDFSQTERFAQSELALGVGARSSILRRFEMIADSRLSHRLSRWSKLVLVALMAVLLCIPVRGHETEPSTLDPPDGAEVADQDLQVFKPESAGDEQGTLVSAGDRSEAIFLTGIVFQQTANEAQDQPTVWLVDRTTDKRTFLRKGATFSVGRTMAAVEEIKKDTVMLKINGKARTWKLGTNFAALLDDTKSSALDTEEQSSKPAARDQPVRADSQRFKVQLELIGDQVLIHGDEEDVKRVSELLRRLEQGKLKTPRAAADGGPPGPSTPAATLQSYSLGSLDPKTVEAVLQTMLAESPGVRMAVDPNTDKLIVLGHRDNHATVQSTLDKMQPAAGHDVGDRKRAENGGKLRFAFDKLPWSDVLQWYAEQAGLSLSAEDPIPGTFTYKDAKAYTVTESLDVLNAALLTKGYVLLRQDRWLFVVDTKNGIPPELVPRVEIDELDERGSFEFVSVMFPFGGRDAEAARAEILPLLSQGGHAAVLPRTGTLLVTERAGILRSIRKVIQSID